MNWDQYFFDIVNVVKDKSKDRSTKVGAVIVGPDNGVRSTGFNGFPRGVNDDVDARHERPAKYLYTEHAERNAIYNAAKNGTALEGCTMYTTMYPCADCARAIIQAGITRLVSPAPAATRWDESHRVAEEILYEARVRVDKIERP